MKKDVYLFEISNIATTPFLSHCFTTWLHSGSKKLLLYLVVKIWNATWYWYLCIIALLPIRPRWYRYCRDELKCDIADKMSRNIQYCRFQDQKLWPILIPIPMPRFQTMLAVFDFLVTKFSSANPFPVREAVFWNHLSFQTLINMKGKIHLENKKEKEKGKKEKQLPVIREIVIYCSIKRKPN